MQNYGGQTLREVKSEVAIEEQCSAGRLPPPPTPTPTPLPQPKAMSCAWSPSAANSLTRSWCCNRDGDTELGHRRLSGWNGLCGADCLLEE